MIYVLYIFIFSTGGEIPTEREQYTYTSMAECRANALIIQGDIGAPTESICVETKNG